MPGVSQIEQALKYSLEEQANILARQMGCIQRHRKFSGADLVQILVFCSACSPGKVMCSHIELERSSSGAREN